MNLTVHFAEKYHGKKKEEKPKDRSGGMIYYLDLFLELSTRKSTRQEYEVSDLISGWPLGSQVLVEEGIQCA